MNLSQSFTEVLLPRSPASCERRSAGSRPTTESSDVTLMSLSSCADTENKIIKSGNQDIMNTLFMCQGITMCLQLKYKVV